MVKIVSGWYQEVSHETLTAVEAAAYGGDDDLESKETTHSEEDGAFLLVDGVYPNNVHDRTCREENSCADGLEEEEVRALLWDGERN